MNLPFLLWAFKLKCPLGSAGINWIFIEIVGCGDGCFDGGYIFLWECERLRLSW